jgi:hypothetical protein
LAGTGPLVLRCIQMTSSQSDRLARPWAGHPRETGKTLCSGSWMARPTAVRLNDRDNAGSSDESNCTTVSTLCPDLFRVSTSWWPRSSRPRKTWMAGSSPVKGIFGCVWIVVDNRLPSIGQPRAEPTTIEGTVGLRPALEGQDTAEGKGAGVNRRRLANKACVFIVSCRSRRQSVIRPSMEIQGADRACAPTPRL